MPLSRFECPDEAGSGVTRLADAAAAELADRPFTYAAVGATATALPAGFRILHRTRMLRAGTDFEHAAQQLMSWRLHSRAGLHVAVSDPTARAGAVVELGLGVWALRIAAPCRVVYVVDTPDERGFAYGTVSGHPESGEERFLLSRRDDGRIQLAIDAFSRPRTALARLGGPMTRLVQHRIADRYLHALDD